MTTEPFRTGGFSVASSPYAGVTPVGGVGVGEQIRAVAGLLASGLGVLAAAEEPEVLSKGVPEYASQYRSLVGQSV